MLWLTITIIAYFILAVVNLTDKFLLDKFLPSHWAYTFLVGVSGLIVWPLAPWFLEWPGWWLFFLNLGVGLLFPAALLLMYRALKLGEASRIIPLMGGIIPVFILVLSLVVLRESFTLNQWLAILLLIAGTVIISWFPESHELWFKIKAWFSLGAIDRQRANLSALGAAIFFGLFFIGSKYLYTQQPFFSSFIWVRLGSFLAVLVLLAIRTFRREIFNGLSKLKKKGKTIFVSNQLLAAAGFLLQNYAISIASVVLVTALQGVQYALLLVGGGILSVFFPKLLKEKITPAIIIQKAFAVILIAVGLYLIAI